MAKKNIKAKALVKADLSDERWINTPFFFSTFGADFSLLQQDIMFMVSSHLQSYITKFFAEGRDKESVYPNALFSEKDFAEGLPSIKIKLSDLAVLDSNYGSIKDAVEEIFNFTLKVPKAGGGFTDWLHMFSKMTVPNSLNKYHYVDDKGVMQAVDRSLGYIDVKINPDVALYVFDMNKGYINHLALIARYSSKRVTPRLYLYLMRYVSQNRMVARVSIDELKEYLGFVQVDKTTGERTVQYPKFSHFRTKILDAAQQDLEDMSLQNQSEIVFSYKLLYRQAGKLVYKPPKEAKGNPDLIEFIIKRSDLGNARNMIVHRSTSVRKFIGSLKKRCPDLQVKELEELTMNIPDNLLNAFLDYGYKDVWKLVERTQPDDVAAYVMTLFRNWANKEQTDVAMPMKSPRQLSLFNDAGTELWTRCVQDLCSKVSDDVARDVFGKLRLESWDDTTRVLMLQVPSIEVRDKIESDYLQIFKASLTKHYAKFILKYRIINN